MLTAEHLKLGKERFQEKLKIKRERLAQIKGGIQKRVLALTVFLIIFGVLWYEQRTGFLQLPPIVDTTIEFFLVSIASLWFASVFVRLTVSRVFQFFESEMEVEQHILITKIYSIFIYLLAVGVILWKLGISSQNLVLYLGFVTTGIALSLSQLLFSFAVWLIILNKKPIRMGDVVCIDNNVGVVTKVGTFFLTIESIVDPKETIKIPNKILLDKPILNMGRDRMYQEIRLSITKVPKDLDQRLKRIREFLSAELDEAESIKISVDASETKWFLKIKLIIKPEHEGKKSEILKAIYPLLKDILKHKD
jgi:MscS family membrane protein